MITIDMFTSVNDYSTIRADCNRTDRETAPENLVRGNVREQRHQMRGFLIVDDE